MIKESYYYYYYFPPELCPTLRTWTILLQHIDRRDVLSERYKLDRRRSTKLTIPPSSDSRPL